MTPRIEHSELEVSQLQVDLSKRAKRLALSTPALKAFFTIIDKWQVRSEDAMLLLGGIAKGRYYELKKSQSSRVLSMDTLTRISYVIGVFTALNVLHGQQLADKWVQLPNAHRVFGGATPLQYMIKGGIPALHIVRQLLEARLEGS